MYGILIEFAFSHYSYSVSGSDTHKSHYPWSWFYDTLNGSSSAGLAAEGYVLFYAIFTLSLINSQNSDKKLWGSNITSNPPEVSFKDVMDSKRKAGLAELTDSIVSHFTTTATRCLIVIENIWLLFRGGHTSNT